MIQITGKSAYKSFQDVHDHKNRSDVQDFISNPGLLNSSLEYEIESAFVFLFSKAGASGVKLATIALTGSVVDVTQLVNGGQNGYADRNHRFQAVAAIMGVAVGFL